MAVGERLICAASALVEGGLGVRFDVQWAGEMTPAFVVRYDGAPVAYLNRCGHVPVEMDFNAGEFLIFRAYILYALRMAHYMIRNPALVVVAHAMAGVCISWLCWNVTAIFF